MLLRTISPPFHNIFKIYFLQKESNYMFIYNIWLGQFLRTISPHSTIFSKYISNKRSQITCSFIKFGCSIGIFLNSANLICRRTDISKCFRGSLRLRDNESRLYVLRALYDKSRFLIIAFFYFWLEFFILLFLLSLHSVAKRQCCGAIFG